jgi:hypothetical protein
LNDPLLDYAFGPQQPYQNLVSTLFIESATSISSSSSTSNFKINDETYPYLGFFSQYAHVIGILRTN